MTHLRLAVLLNQRFAMQGAGIKISREKITNFGIFAAIALGIIFPSPPEIKKFLPFILALLLLSSFLKINMSARIFMRPQLLAWPVIALGITPAAVFFLTQGFNTDLRLGLMIAAVTPSAIASPVVSDMIGGDRELSIAQVLVSNILSPGAYALILYLYFSAGSIQIPVIPLVRDIGLLIALPFLASRLINRSQKIRGIALKGFRHFNPVAFIAIIFIAVSASSAQLRTLPVKELIILLASSCTLAAFYFSCGALIPGTLEVKKSLAVGLGHKNNSLAIWVALSNFNPAVVLPMVAYLIFHHVINGLLIHRFHR